MKIRIEVTDDKELKHIIECLKAKYNIIFVSKAYKNRNNDNVRYYITVN